MFFKASDFTSTTRDIHNWALFLLWLSLFTPFGAICLLSSSSTLGIYQPGEFIFQCHIFLPFILFMAFSMAFSVERVRDFIFRGSKITADGDCSHEIKRCLLLGGKVMINLDSMLKSGDIENKGLSSQSYGFSSSQVWI